MIHISLKVNCTGCSAETACSLPCTWTCSSSSVTGLGQISDISLWPFVLQQLFTEQAAGKGKGKWCWELTHKHCPFMGALTQAWVTSQTVWSDHASNSAKVLSNRSLLLDLQRMCQEMTRTVQGGYHVDSLLFHV